MKVENNCSSRKKFCSKTNTKKNQAFYLHCHCFTILQYILYYTPYKLYDIIRYNIPCRLRVSLWLLYKLDNRVVELYTVVQISFLFFSNISLGVKSE